MSKVVKRTSSKLKKQEPSTDKVRTSRMLSRVSSVTTISGDIIFPLRLDVIQLLCTFIQQNCLQTEGIFRLSGTLSHVLLLYNQFDQDISDIILSPTMDPHIVSGALKHYLRVQINPVVPFHIFKPFITAWEEHETSSDEDKLNALIPFIEKLPPENKPIFRRLWMLLAEIKANEEVNKMSSKNLGIVFGPTLMKEENEDPMSIVKNSAYSSAIFEFLINHHAKVLAVLPKGMNYRVFGNPSELTEADWNLLTTNAKRLVFKKNEVVLAQGIENSSLYRCIVGSLRVEIGGRKVAKMGTGSFFGELSFLGSAKTTATVVANDDSTCLYQLESTFAKSIFEAEPALYYKFYYKLAYTIADRLVHREKGLRKSSVSQDEEDKNELISQAIEQLNDISKRRLLRRYLQQSSNENAKIASYLGMEEQFFAAETNQERLQVATGIFHSFLKEGSGFPDIGNLAFAQAIYDAINKGVVENYALKELESRVVEYLSTNVIAEFKQSELYINATNQITLSVELKDRTVEVTCSINDTLAAITGQLMARVKNAKNYKLYIVSKTGNPRVLLTTSKVQDVAALIDNNTQIRYTNNIVLDQKKRNVFGNAIVLKEYKCKLQRSGVLYITKLELSHIAKCLGLEKKQVILFDDIIDIKLEKANVKLSINKEKKSKLIKFSDTKQATEAYNIIFALFKTGDDDDNSKVSATKSAPSGTTDKKPGLSKSMEIRLKFKEAICIKEFSASNPNEVTLHVNDIVLVSRAIGDKWFGNCNGSSGEFPSACVKIIEVDDKSTNQQQQKQGQQNNGAKANNEQKILSVADWEFILMGGREVSFKKDDVILKQGDEMQRIYQIIDGTCRVEKEGFDEPLARMGAGVTFGEISFLLGGGASASILADSDTSVFIIEAEYFKRIFNDKPLLAGHWFKYLATILQERIARKK